MGGSVGKSSSKQQNSFSQKIPKFQETALSQLFGSARNLFDSSTNELNKLVPGAQNYSTQVADSALPVLKNNAAGGAYGGLGLGSTLMGSLNKSLSGPTATQEINNLIMGGAGNNYADAMKASYLGDANSATSNMLSNLDARAAASGMSGGARHGIATSQGLYDINSNLQKNLADTGFSTFDKDLDRKLQIAGQADAGTLNRQQMLSAMLGQQQGVTDNVISQGRDVQNLGMGTFAPVMAPWDAMANYSSVVGAPTVLSSGHGSGSGKGMGIGANFGGKSS